MTVNIKWRRHQHITREFDPTLVVEWTMFVDDRKMLTVTEFQGIYQTTFHVPTRLPELKYWQVRAQYLEDQWQAAENARQGQTAEAEWDAVVANMTPEQRREMESMTLVDEEMP